MRKLAPSAARLRDLVSEVLCRQRAETAREIRMLRGSINHVSITVSDLDQAMKFFRPLLELLGYNIGQVIQDPNGQRLTVNVLPGLANVAVNIWEAKPEFAKHAFEVYEVGLHHLAFNVEKHEQVDQVHDLVKQLGAEILDGPGEFPYAGPDGWYAVYFLGPDRLKFEVVHMPAAEKAYTDTIRVLSAGRRDSQRREGRSPVF